MKRKRPKRSAATMVEFAIVANLLFVLIFASMELARINMARNLAQDAAYYAARVAMVPGATAAEANAEVDRIMGTLLNSQGYSSSVDELDFDSDTVEVTVTVDMKKIALFTPMFMPQTKVDYTAKLRTERYEGFYEQ